MNGPPERTRAAASRQRQRTLSAIFQCADQSALIHNFVASEDPPPGAWSHHATPQSPLGKVSFPEVFCLRRGHVLTRRRPGQLLEHALTGHDWWPWEYRGRGPGLRVERTVTRDVWLARVRLARGAPGLLLLECQPVGDVALEYERTRAGLRFRWDKGFAVDLRFDPAPRALDLSDDPDSLKRRFAGFTDVPLNAAHAQWAWREAKTLWVGVPFTGSLVVRLAVRRTNRRPLIVSYDRARRAEQRRWEQFFADQVPPLRTTDPVVRDTYYFAWQTFWANHCRGGRGVLRGPFTSAARLSYGSQWWWDQAFHAVILRHRRDPRLTYAEFENFWRAQQPDGSIVGALRFTLDDIAQHHAQFYRQTMKMQPPVIGAVLPLLREHPGWPRDLARWHAALSRHAAWHLRPDRDTDRDGLAEYHHNIESSGDQNQRWDSQKLDPTKTIDHLRPTESVDDNVWLALLWQSLAEMAQQLGRARQARAQARRAQRLWTLIEERMWDDRDGFYYDLDGRSHRKIRVKTPYGFMPLLWPGCRRDRAERLVREHLLNPRQFWCRYPLPSVSLDDPTFDPVDMWRGPTWVNVNWLVVQGLKRQGFLPQAIALARQTIELVGPRYAGKQRLRSPRIWEWYHPHTGEPLGNNQYSWSALVIDFILDPALGLTG